jgi:hypothetical protein
MLYTPLWVAEANVWLPDRGCPCKQCHKAFFDAYGPYQPSWHEIVLDVPEARR